MVRLKMGLEECEDSGNGGKNGDTLAMDEAVLSSTFSVAQNNINVELLDGMDNFYYTFFIIENKRKVTKNTIAEGYT